MASFEQRATTSAESIGDPRVTVVVPCYNLARFLPEAVRSVLAQTYREFEIVIVDDGSPDDTALVAERLCREQPAAPIRLLRRENGGISAALNSGVAAGRGEFVVTLSADDLLSPRFLEEAVAALDRLPECSIAYGPIQNFGAIDVLHRPAAYDLVALTRANLMGAASLFRRRAWEDVGGWSPMASYEDWEFWIACGERGHVGTLVPGALYYYRVRPDSLYRRAVGQDRQLKAEIVLYHPRLYSSAQVEWARLVLDEDPGVLDLSDELGVVPDLPGDRPHWSGSRLPGARTLTVLADAEELLAHPELLDAWAQTFDDGDGVTLAVCGGQSARFAELARAVSADLAALPDEASSSPQLCQWVSGVYSERPAATLHRGLPRVERSGLADLRTEAAKRRPLRRAIAA